MTFSGRKAALAIAALAMAAPTWAADGVLIVQKVTMGTAPAQVHQIQIDQKRIRMEAAAGRGGASQVFVFDGTREVLLMIDDANKSYSEMTKAEVIALGNQVSAAMAQMQEAMKNMPPEQRERMEAMMKGRMGGAAGAAPAPLVYKKVGTDTVGTWTCDKYEGYSNGAKTQEVCTVDPKVLGFTMADFEVTKELQSFFQQLAPASAQSMFRVGSAGETGFSGVPVRTVVTAGGQTITSELSEVKRQSFADSIFQAPAGYQKKESPFSAMGRGRRGGGE